MRMGSLKVASDSGFPLRSYRVERQRSPLCLGGFVDSTFLVASVDSAYFTCCWIVHSDRLCCLRVANISVSNVASTSQVVRNKKEYLVENVDL